MYLELLSSFQRRFLACQVWTYDLNIVSASQKPIWWNSGFICKDLYLKSRKCIKINVHPLANCKPPSCLYFSTGTFSRARICRIKSRFRSISWGLHMFVQIFVAAVCELLPKKNRRRCPSKCTCCLICLSIAYVTMRGISVGIMKSVYPDPEQIHRPQETNVFKLPFVVEAVAETRVTKKYARPVVDTLFHHRSPFCRNKIPRKCSCWCHRCHLLFFFLFSFKLNLFAVVNASHANRVVVNCSKYIRLSWKRWLVPNRTNHQDSVNVYRFVKSQKILDEMGSWWKKSAEPPSTHLDSIDHEMCVTPLNQQWSVW